MSDQADASVRKLPADTEEKQDSHARKKESSSVPVRSQYDLTSKAYRFRSENEYSRQALIINNLSKSTGEKDSKLMENTLMETGFKVTIITKLSVEELVTHLGKASDAMPSETDCFMCVVMASGGRGFIKGYGETKMLTIEKLSDPFRGNRCQSLVLKPKIFIIMSWDKDPDSRIVSDGDQDEPKISKIPTDSDVLIYACHMSGYQGYDDKGSWFIQSLSDVIQKNREHSEMRDFLRLTTIINREMVKKGTKLKRSECIPTATSTLTKLVYL
ncbi:caspase-7-like [Ylistrum balloti]|uniref:caspase-7-like n=1 Tax=Ylistrum balloti TaxID=509963 RepID=UPI0029059169|nr:caspase-7-like [Ylistrum balloti]